MSSNKGTIIYGDLSVISGYDVQSSGVGALTVAGNTLLAGSTNTINGQLGVYDASVFHSDLAVHGTTTYYGQVNFTASSSFTGDTLLTSTTQSTSISTGAFQVAGGMAIVKNTWIGGTLNAAGNTTLQGTLNVSSTTTHSGVVTITNTTNSINSSNGALVVAGGIGVLKDIQSGSGNLYLAGSLSLASDPETNITYLASPSNILYISQNAEFDTIVNDSSTANFNVSGITNTNQSGFQVLLTTDATSYSDGSVQIAGGVSVQKSLWVNTNLHVAGTASFSGGLSFTATTQTTSTSTGSLTLLGGAGIAKNVYLGGILDVQSNSNSTSFIGSIGFVYNNSSVNYIQSGDQSRTASSWQPLKFSPVGNTTSIMSILSDQVKIDQTTASTSSSTGSLVVAGGFGLAGDLYVNSTSNFAGAANFNNNVWLGGNNLFLNTNNSQTDGLVFSDEQSAGGPFLFGLLGGALGTTNGSTLNALTWDTDQSVQIFGTTDTTDTSTGALTVAGGIAVAKSISVGTSIFLKASSFTSTGNNVYINANSSNINLRNAAGSTSGEFESTNLLFNFRTINITSPTSIPPFITFQVDKTSGYTYVYQTDDASAVNTGSFQVSGGASIAKNLYVNGSQWIAGDINVSGSINSVGNSPVSFSSTTDSISPTTGAVIIAGGLGIAKNTFMGGSLNILDTTASISVTTGSFVTAGGAGFGSDIYVAGSGNFGTDMTINGITNQFGIVTIDTTESSSSPSTGSLIVTGGLGLTGSMYMTGQEFIQNTTQSSSPSTGALIVSGGAGFSGNIYTSGIINITLTTDSTSITSGSFITAGGIGIKKSAYIGGNVDIAGGLTVAGNITSSGGTVTFTNTVDATASTSASVVVSGGLGVVKAMYVGSTVNSTSSSTGALVLSGGLGIAKDFFLGGNQTLAGSNPLLTFTNSGSGAPSFTSRSSGTKILLLDSLGATSADYAIGIDSNTSWCSIPEKDATLSFAWYGGNTLIHSMDGLGNIQNNSTTNSSSSTTGAIITLGGAGIGKSLFVGGAINVTNTAYFGATITAAANYIGTGTISTSNVTNSSSTTSGSIKTAGGLGVLLDVYIGGGLNVGANSVLTGTLQVNGTSSFMNTTESSSTGTGSMVIVGGVGIAKNLNVGGNAIISGNATVTGNFFVNGTTTSVNTSTLTTTENVITVNNAPSGTSYGGLSIKRYQLANDTSQGDVIVTPVQDYQGTCMDTGTALYLYLDSGASAVNDYYKGYWVHIYGGSASGQVRKIKSYDGDSKQASIYNSADQAASQNSPVDGLDFTSPFTDNTSTFRLYSSEYIATVWDEVNDEYFIGGTPVNPSIDPTFPLRSTVTVHAKSLKLDENLYVDTILEKTLNAGVTVEDILMKDGTIDSGLISINGSLVDVTSTVQLIDNNINASVTIPGTQTFGAYTILVMDSVNTGSSACFNVCGSTSRGGSVFRAVSSTGANNEHLTISWAQGDYPQLKYMTLPTNGSGDMISYIVRVTRVV